MEQEMSLIACGMLSNFIGCLTLMRYPWLAYQLEDHGIPTILTNFPDPVNARESIWKSFVCDVLQADEHTILIGHSSGAACTMRYASLWSSNNNSEYWKSEKF